MLVFCSSGGNAHGLYRTYAVALLLAYIGFGDTYGEGSFPTHFCCLSLSHFVIQWYVLLNQPNTLGYVVIFRG